MKRAFFSTMSFTVMIVMAFAFTIVTFGSSGSAEAALSTAGKITNVDGKVAVFRKNKTKGVRAKVGTLIFPGDKIKTYDDSKAQITLRDNSKIMVAPNSIMKMGKFMLERKTEKRSAFLSLLGGKIRIVAQKMYKLTASGKRKLWRSSNFKIKTPTAVVGVKGTDFVVTVKMKDGTTYTGIIVLEGLVTAQAVNELGQYSAATLIGMMQSVEVTEKGVGPKKPFKQADVDQLLQDIKDDAKTKEKLKETLEDGTIEDLEKMIEDDDTLDEETKEELTQQLDEMDTEGMTDEEIKESAETLIDQNYSDTTMESFTVTESPTSGGGTSCTSEPCI